MRRIGSSVIGGFAGRAADGLSLLERLEAKLETHPNQVRGGRGSGRHNFAGCSRAAAAAVRLQLHSCGPCSSCCCVPGGRSCMRDTCVLGWCLAGPSG